MQRCCHEAGAIINDRLLCGEHASESLKKLVAARSASPGEVWGRESGSVGHGLDAVPGLRSRSAGSIADPPL
jgi:hypothetical protein